MQRQRIAELWRTVADLNARRARQGDEAASGRVAELEAGVKTAGAQLVSLTAKDGQQQAREGVLAKEAEQLRGALHDNQQQYASLSQELETVRTTQAGVLKQKDAALQAGRKTLDETRAALTQALEASEKTVAQAQSAQRAQTDKSGKAYMADFARRKGVKKHPDGFLYHVDYAGSEPIADTNVVTIVVKESLTDGKVINDMDVTGAVVSQPLNAYPGLFQSAIRLLKSHGSITLVVPPALAYGETGFPPDIPPGATLVYSLRIQDVASPKAKGS